MAYSIAYNNFESTNKNNKCTKPLNNVLKYKLFIKITSTVKKNSEILSIVYTQTDSCKKITLKNNPFIFKENCISGRRQTHWCFFERIIELCLTYNPDTNTETNTPVRAVYQAQNRIPLDINGLTDPFCKLNIHSNVKRTSPQNQKFEI